MASSSTPRCDCCGLNINAQRDEECPRCGYPIAPAREASFLATSIHDLRRVAAYGGAQTTVSKLIARYQFRLQQLQASIPSAVAPSVPTVRPVAAVEVTRPLEAVYDDRQPTTVLGSPAQPAAPIFSLKSFVADHTINIVASLGAFLILTGALSFVATTRNLLLSFLAIFVVHAIFGAVGLTTYKFRHLRIISVIYSAIFALLIPLVGFSGYRLVLGQVVPMSSSTVIAIAAAYAACIYAFLAIYQQFSPFSYLAGIALAVADLATASALHLYFGWWPVGLLLLALPLLLFVERNNALQWPFAGSLEILRKAAQTLMWTVVAIGCLALLFSFNADLVYGLSYEFRWIAACLVWLLFAWVGLHAWLRKSLLWTLPLPYLLLLCITSLAYVLNLPPLGYACSATITAWGYALLARFVLAQGQPVQRLRFHMYLPSLLLAGIVPLIIAPSVPILVLVNAFAKVYTTLPGNAFWQILLLIASGMLSLFVLFCSTGWQKTPASSLRSACWLLLVSGVLFEWAYGVLLLSVHGRPLWWLLGMTLAVVALAVVVRRRTSAYWSNSLDVFALWGAVQTLALSLGQSSDLTATCAFLFAVISYSLIVCQRRFSILWLSCVFAIIALPFVWARPLMVLVLGLGLPFLAVGIKRSGVARWPVTMGNVVLARVSSALSWEWPLLLTGFLCGLSFALYAMIKATGGVVPASLALPFSPPLWLACLALFWYVAAVAADEREWLLGSVTFATIALLMPGDTFTVLVYLAPALLIAGWSVGRVRMRAWAWPFYASSLLSLLVMGFTGSAVAMSSSFTATFVALLIYAVLAYSLLLFERKPALSWIATVLVLWAAYLVLQDVACFGIGTTSCHVQGPAALLLLTGLVFATGCLGIVTGRVVPMVLGAWGTSGNVTVPTGGRFAWNGAWYLAAFVTLCATVGWGYAEKALLPADLVLACLLAFIAFTLLIMLIERLPEIVMLATLLVALTIWQLSLPLWQQTLVFDLLCVLTFAAQFIWRRLAPSHRLFDIGNFHLVLAGGGMALVILSNIEQGGLNASAPRLALTGACSLLVLAILLFWHGRLQSSLAWKRWCTYGSGLSLALIPAWLIAAFLPGHPDWVSLVPASYLVIVAPFLARDDSWSSAQGLGRVSALVGAVLLFLPTLWLSFHQNNIQPTMFLTLEAVALLLLGLVTRTRLFVLSGTALVIVGVMHALFIPSLGLPLSLALVIMGGCLLTIATALSLARHSLLTLWAQWK